MQILKKTGIDWSEGSLSSKLYMDQSAEVELDQGVTRCVKFGGGDDDTLCRRFLFK